MVPRTRFGEPSGASVEVGNAEEEQVWPEVNTRCQGRGPTASGPYEPGAASRARLVSEI